MSRPDEPADAGSILMAALLTVGVAYAALLTARVTLPAADQLARSGEVASADR